jgi:hypothetical protein
LILHTIHNPADVCQASPAFGVFGCALAIVEFFFGLDFFRYQRASVYFKILFNILAGIFKTVTDVIVHFS